MIIALASTVIVFVGLAFAIANAPGWPQVHEKFFNGHRFVTDFPDIASAFLLNVKIFAIAEALILPLALIVAVLRSLPGPVFFPIRALAIAYVDIFRGIPTILLILLLGFGAPTLKLSWIPKSELFWATTAQKNVERGTPLPSVGAPKPRIRITRIVGTPRKKSV